MAIRSLAHAAECLTDRREQEEVLQIFQKINKETGWKINFVFKELKEKWNWVDEPAPQAAPLAPLQAMPSQSLLQSAAPLQHQQQSYQQYPNNVQQQSVAAPPATAPAPAPAPYRRPPSGIINPMFANADFTMSSHPYQNVYVPAIQNPNASTLYY